ncbi:MAG: hypothetical protein JSS60_08020 [Verrucomicrobia bacterium]|nr:hypothetical protein [Verrucomicrobiota bacterium]
MRHLPVLFSLMALFAVSSCSQKEEGEEPDYDNMVMADEEDDFTSDEERDRKVIAGDLPDPRELIILEPALLNPEDQR